MSESTQETSRLPNADGPDAGELMRAVYTELRSLAAEMLAKERPGHTLQATALVHAAFIRLVGHDGARSNWIGRNYFFAAAAEAMRRILIESARSKKSEKRRAGYEAVPLRDLDVPNVEVGLSDDDLLALNEALCRLREEDPRKEELVKLRFFTGLSIVEAAEVMGISRATAVRYWDYARSWLYAELHPESPGEDEK
ncbi:MAG: ECF-type sigma factor [Pirellulales bacterium]